MNTPNPPAPEAQPQEGMLHAYIYTVPRGEVVGLLYSTPQAQTFPVLPVPPEQSREGRMLKEIFGQEVGPEITAGGTSFETSAPETREMFLWKDRLSRKGPLYYRFYELRECKDNCDQAEGWSRVKLTIEYLSGGTTLESQKMAAQEGAAIPQKILQQGAAVPPKSGQPNISAAPREIWIAIRETDRGETACYWFQNPNRSHDPFGNKISRFIEGAGQ